MRRGMIFAVKFFVNRSVAQAKIGAKIDDARAKIDKRFGEFGRHAVRERQKNNVSFARECFGIGIAKLNAFAFSS